MLNFLRSTATVLLGLAVGIAHAADCDGRQSAGYRVLTLESGRKVAVWYPAATEEKPFAYARTANDFMGSVAFNAPPAACPRVPLVLFSHGLGGCGLQTLFLTAVAFSGRRAARWCTTCQQAGGMSRRARQV